MGDRKYVYGRSALVVGLGPDNENLVPLAQDVAEQRAIVVAESMLHMAAIRSLGTARSAALVQCAAAQVQSKSATDGQQAAHLLPGQILVDSKPVWLLAATSAPELLSDVMRLQQQTQMCFAATNVLPAVFNRADTEAEGKERASAAQTLKPLFGSVVQDMWRTARVDPRQPLAIDRPAVFRSLESWFGQVSRVYSDASRRKTDNGHPEEALILATYADSFSVVNVGRFVAARAPQIGQRYRFLA